MSKNFESFQESKTGTLKKLEKASALSASEKPEDQDRAREYRVAADFKSWRNQKRSGKLKEEVGVSSSAKMKEAQKEAALKAKEEAAVKKAKKVKEEVEEVDEATRYSKETGKNLKSGKPYVKGGTAKGDTAYKNVLARIKQEYGANAVQQSSKEPKKVKGDKTRRQVGDRKFTPADTIAKRRAAKAAYIKSRSGD